jgi:hypothetical protein
VDCSGTRASQFESARRHFCPIHCRTQRFGIPYWRLGKRDLNRSTLHLELGGGEIWPGGAFAPLITNPHSTPPKAEVVSR